MSGGSWNYIFRDVKNAAEELCLSKEEYRLAFGRHLLLVADALKQIEWVDSGDCSPGDDIESISRCIHIKQVLAVCIENAEETIDKLQKLIAKAEKNENTNRTRKRRLETASKD